MADTKSRVILKSYRNLILLPTILDRFEYLRIKSNVGEPTFGFDRILNQGFYQSREWRQIRMKVIARDEGCDLGMPDYPIGGKVIIHHINPITAEDIENASDLLFDLDNLICVSESTHNAIHFGDETLLPAEPIVRLPGDTCPWR